LHRAQEIAPHYAELLINLAIAENATGESASAESHFQGALRLAPFQPDSYIFYGRYLLAHSRIEEAQSLLRRALELSPGDITANDLLKDSEAHGDEIHTKLGDSYLRKGKYRQGSLEYETALRYPPHLVGTLNNYAWLLSTCPESAIRDGAKAIQLAEEADRLSQGQSPIVLRTLAAALAQANRFQEAMKTARRAAELARAQGNDALARKVTQDMSYYENARPLQLTPPARERP
jgi:tetratricopeptide (TPR) repeat protein